MISENFSNYIAFSPAVPVWRVTDPSKPTIHRFFDSSPISPSGRYIALTEFPFQDRLPLPGECASVVVTDLQTGSIIYHTDTAAWDTQTGAHVQWGSDDNSLLFNRMDQDIWKPYGISVDPLTGIEFKLGGTIYHVSRDGNYSVSPDLVKITIAQAGYGVHVPPASVTTNRGAPSDDGIFVTNIRTGKCTLLASLSDIAQAIAPNRFNLDAGSCYGFHTKWNADGSRIMFILRWFPKGSLKSENWLVTVDAEGGDIQVAVSPDRWGDGHHPNWYPTGNGIVMNLPSAHGLIGKVRTIIGKVGRRLRLPLGGVPLEFNRLEFDGSGLYSLAPHIGSGHPTIHPDGNYLLSDSYLNEPPAFSDGSVPIRTIDIGSGMLRTPIRIDCQPLFAGPKREYRIDPHPAWHPTGRWLTFNGAVNGVRAVFVADFAGYTSA